ncbi:MAG: hypothetical protein M1447_03105 [Gammaproteobacteria bacterium]|nr:hypothetical protein [Gammaproteobacteria bacterium]
MTVQNALESLTLTWGGIGDILVPTDATGMPLPVFRNVVRAFDPDYICGYVADQKDASSSSQFMYELRESMNPLTKGISEARDWCSPFKSQQFVFPHAASGRPLPYPLVSLYSLHDLPETADIDLSSSDRYFELMVRMRFGGIPGPNDLNHTSHTECITPQASQYPALVEYAMTGSTIMTDGGPLAALLGGSSMAKGAGWLTPLQRTAHGMGYLYPSRQNRWVIVTGNTCGDFCLALACDRLFTGATWLPDELASQDRFRGALDYLLNSRASLRGLLADTSFTSISLGEADVEAFRSRYFTRGQDEAYTWSQVVPPDALIFSHPKRIANVESLKCVESSMCYIDDSQTLTVGSPLNPPVPPVARAADPLKICWEVEVFVEGSKVPPRGVLAQKDLLATGLNNSNDAIGPRAGSDGIVYHSHPIAGLLQPGLLLEQQLVRPRLRMPSVTDVMRRLAELAGYEVRPSQTGRLNQLILNLWGGLEATALDLTGPIWNLISEFICHYASDNADRSKRRSLVVHGIPYLTASQAKDLLGADERTTRGTLDRLITRSILRRGLLLRCSRCNWLDWYSSDHFGSRFDCKRCDHENVIVAARWNNPILEPDWYYDLDHAVREGLDKNGRVPILAMDKLRSQIASSFTFATDFEMVKMGDGKPKLEIDFAIELDGQLILGEAKTTDRIDKDRKTERQKITRFADVAALLSIDAICFATLAREWNQSTKSFIESTAASKRLGSLFLEGLGVGESH